MHLEQVIPHLKNEKRASGAQTREKSTPVPHFKRCLVPSGRLRTPSEQGVSPVSDLQGC
jgi:hypothetical protein